MKRIILFLSLMVAGISTGFSQTLGWSTASITVAEHEKTGWVFNSNEVQNVAEMTITLSAPINDYVYIDIDQNTSGIAVPATNGVDYGVVTDYQLIIPPNTTSMDFDVRILDDSYDEPTEAVKFTITGATRHSTGAAVALGTSTITMNITDDEYVAQNSGSDPEVLITGVGSASFSNTANQYIELLVTEDDLDLVHYKFGDTYGNYGNTLADGFPMAGYTFFSEKKRFTNNPLWQNLKSGTIIVIYLDDVTPPGGNDVDKSDGFIRVGAQNTTYFEGGDEVQSLGLWASNGTSDHRDDLMQIVDDNGNHVIAFAWHYNTDAGCPCGNCSATYTAPGCLTCPGSEPIYSGCNNTDPICWDNWNTGNCGSQTTIPNNRVMGRAMQMRRNQEIYVLQWFGGYTIGMDQWTLYGSWGSQTIGYIQDDSHSYSPARAPLQKNCDFVWRPLREAKMAKQSGFAYYNDGASQYEMSWDIAEDFDKGNESTGYLIVRNTSYSFGEPQDGLEYSVGDAIPGGGTVVGVEWHDASTGTTYEFIDNYNTGSFACNYYRVFPMKFKDMTGSYEEQGTAYNEAHYVDLFPATKAYVGPDTTICYGAETAIPVYLYGDAPWSITYEINGTPTTINGITSSPYYIQTTLTSSSTFLLTDVTDGTTCTADLLDPADNLGMTVTVNPFSYEVRWDGNTDGDGGDGVSWNDRFNWECDAVPDANQKAILDHTYIAAAYTVEIDDAEVVDAVEIDPAGGNPITVQIPNSNSNAPTLSADGSGNSGDAIVIESGGTLENISASTTTEAIDITGDFELKDGAVYLHRTPSTDAPILNNLNAETNSLYHYDVLNGAASIVLSNGTTAGTVTFGNLTFSANNPAGTSIGYIWNGSTVAFDVVVNGDFTVQNDAAFLPTMSTNTMNFKKYLYLESTQDPFSLGSSFTPLMNIAFNGTAIQLITTSNGVDAYPYLNVEIDNAAGVFANTNMVINTGGVLELTNGILYTNTTFEVSVLNTSPTGAVIGHAAGGSATSPSYVSGNLRRSLLGTGSYDFPVGTPTNYELINYNFSGQTGMASLLVNFNTAGLGALPGMLFDPTPANEYTDLLNAGFWRADPDAPMSGGTYNVTAYETGYTNGGASVYTVVKRNNSGGNTWALVNDYNMGTEAGGVVTADRQNVNGFSEFAIATGISVLPIELVEFNGQLVSDNDGLLHWTTASEINNDFFILERSFDGIEFEAIAEIDGAGNSSEMISYQYIDEDLPTGTAWYRLTQVDFDGTSTTSEVITLDVLESDRDKGFAVYPNPFVNEIRIVPLFNATGNAHIEILDPSGKLVLSMDQDLANGAVMNLNTEDLSTGLYFVTISQGNSRYQYKVIKR